ncbi:hypothetical protein N7447_010177 [Penicillium robsamsonii]|uniref:uncharacterized protein n=1 Tax=Penicillium robsamsonii TaxID=1792511 RepID=UPI002549248E|nr:uncharacterized protein N7447_010177 [Penicillium robsamsonii]KAJ5813154.1 hypothetical protein N7447_010177 [Penicillium robsamsonii]
MIDDDDALLGSEFNPIVIYVEEDYGYFEEKQLNSALDTDIKATPELRWDKLFCESRDLLADETTNIGIEVLVTPES